MRKKKFMFIALSSVMFLGSFFGCATEEEKPSLSGTTVQIVRDTEFKNGFGAAWNYGTAFNGTSLNETNEQLANRLKKGNVRDYNDIYDPYGVYNSIYMIPKGEIWVDAMPKDEDEIYWCFEEGYHKNFTDIFGTHIDELHAHKLCVNNKVVENTENSLIFEQYNNYGINSSNENYDKNLVKRISSNRNGTIKTYYDCSKEIRNVAYKFDGDFAYDTWPHLYMQHNLRQDYGMDLFSSMQVKFDIKVNRAEQVNTWPQGESDIPGQETVSGSKGQSAIGINSYFLLRYKANPVGVCMFIGHNIFATSAELRGEILTTEQYGNVFYRERINDYSSTGNPPIVGGDWVTVDFDLVDLLTECIAKLQNTEFSVKNTKISDWDLSFYQIGFENMGNWIGEYELKNMSVTGTYR